MLFSLCFWPISVVKFKFNEKILHFLTFDLFSLGE